MSNTMDITSFVHSSREKAFLVGDYASYRHQLSRQLLKLRRRLGRATPKNHKFTKKEPVTAADVASNPAFVRLMLLTAERSWAHAMAMKAAHADDAANDDAVSGSARSHILSRLTKATRQAEALVSLLREKDVAKAKDTDLLEARAYAATMRGVLHFEKHVGSRYEDASAQKTAWSACLSSFADAHVAYTALSRSSKKDVFREVLSATVDPTLRYAAYQSRISRTVPAPTVARQHFSKSDEELHTLVKATDPTALTEDAQPAAAPGTTAAPTGPIPTTIAWRGRTVPLADAAIGQALASTNAAAAQLGDVMKTQLADPRSSTPATLAAAYDPVLTAAADAVDAVRGALAELNREGAGESDSRVQDLRVASLAANAALIGWRVGRNRILISSPPAPASKSSNSNNKAYTFDDGLHFAPLPRASPRHRSKPAQQSKDASSLKPEPTESTPHQLARLTTRHTLLTATLQSLDALSSTPGAARDAAFASELAALRAYFSALRLLAAAHAAGLKGQQRDALALYAAARERVGSVDAADLGAAADADATTGPPQLAVSRAQLGALQRRAHLLAERQRGLVALQMLVKPLGGQNGSEDKEKEQAAGGDAKRPLVETLHVYPSSGAADLSNLVQFPPRLRGVPVKPTFLDLAFNYIEYPGADAKGVSSGSTTAAGAAVDGSAKGEEKAEQKRGWFGFGRR